MTISRWIKRASTRLETFTYLVLVLALMMVVSDMYLLYQWLAA
ncbi:hypothetical protein [Malonomonas rubra]|nr:hypothetical protein [Malonomonas rubra]